MQTDSLMTKNSIGRIEWIDALKGFTILLVIFSHVEFFGLNMMSATPTTKFFMLFRMPLFFFMSGFVAYRFKNEYSTSQYVNDSIRKIRIQVIPTLVFGLLFTCLVKFKGTDYSVAERFCEFILSDTKCGYWFTLVLLEMFVAYYTIRLVSNKYFKKYEDLVLATVSIAFFILPFILPYVFDDYQNSHVWRVLTGTRFCWYFQFFVFGVLCSKYNDIIVKAFSNQYIMACILCVGGVLSYLSLAVFFPSDSYLNNCIYRCINMTSAYFLILIIVAFFWRYSSRFSSKTPVGRSLQYIGKRTLDVYLIHYYIIPTIPCLGTYLTNNPSVVVEFTIVFTISILVALFSLLISNIIRLSPFMGHWLFGVKYQKD